MTVPFRRDLVSTDLAFDVLMVLLETKSAAPKCGKFLGELMDASIQYEAEKGTCEKKSYADIRKAHDLWTTEKVVIEFRKLFTDKTTFMNIYGNSNVVSSRIMQDSFSSEYTFRPNITKKAKKTNV